MARTPIRKWYVLRTFSGHEKKVKEYLESEVERLGYEDKLTQVVIPTETVFEMRAGKKRTREKTSFPGYILLEAIVDPYLREVINGAPSTIGFLGANGEPVPLRPDEVNRILGMMDEDKGEARRSRSRRATRSRSSTARSTRSRGSSRRSTRTR